MTDGYLQGLTGRIGPIAMGVNHLWGIFPLYAPPGAICHSLASSLSCPGHAIPEVTTWSSTIYHSRPSVPPVLCCRWTREAGRKINRGMACSFIVSEDLVPFSLTLAQ